MSQSTAQKDASRPESPEDWDDESVILLRCPGCQATKTVAPGVGYLLCDTCGRPHCSDEGQVCKAAGCFGNLLAVNHI